MVKDAHDIETQTELIAALKFYLEAALESIDAVPADVWGSLPMPGFGRDEAEALLALDPATLGAGSPAGPGGPS